MYIDISIYRCVYYLSAHPPDCCEGPRETLRSRSAVAQLGSKSSKQRSSAPRASRSRVAPMTTTEWPCRNTERVLLGLT